MSTRQSRKGQISTWKAFAPAHAGKLAIESIDRAMRGEGAPSPIYEGEDSVISRILDGKKANYKVPLPKKNEEKIVPENKKSDKEESLISNEEKKDIITSHNNLPIDILIDLKSFFEDKLINEKEYNHLRKLALSIAKESQSKEGLEKIKSISREKLTELRNLFNEELIDKDEYDDLRKNLIEIE